MTTAPTPRTRIHRVPRRASYDAAVLHAILDDALVCHVAFADAQGVHGIPTACWRIGEHLHIHGSNGSRMLKRLADRDCCVTIAHVDGLVLSRAAFGHVMNYRSAVVYGRFAPITDPAAKRAAMEALMDRLLPGRQADVRAASDQEYAAMTVMRIPLAEAACKVRAGPPSDDAADMERPVWAGVLPFARTRGAPVPDPHCAARAPGQPAYVRDWQD